MDEPLYLDIRGLSSLPFQFFIGGRGIGKTYSALQECATDRFLYLRHSETEIKLSCSPVGNPFKVFNRDFNREIEPGKGTEGVYTFTEGERLVGYGAALSTFFNKRGVDLSDVNIIFFDEFIPEKLKIVRAGYGETFKNLYETVNRNRELKGRPPVKVIFCANALSLSNEILIKYKLIKPIYAMARAGQIKWSDPKRGIFLWYSEKHAVTEAKKQTALYKALGDDNEGGIDATFKFNAKTKYNPRDFVPYASFNIFTVHRHKSGPDMLVTSGAEHPAKYKYKDLDILPFKDRVAWLIEDSAEQGKLYYDNETTMLLFENLLK